MKKQLFLGVVAIMATGAAMAQDGTAQKLQAPAQNQPATTQGMQMKTPGERTKEMQLKLQSDLQLTNEQMASLYDPFMQYYNARQKNMEAMRQSGNMDRDKMKASMDELNAVRDKQLSQILTPAQMKRWTNEIEPSMRPVRKDAVAPKQ